MFKLSSGSLRRMIAFLYLLNCVDLLYTNVLISSGKFMEANPIMDAALQSPISTILVKLIIPGAILLLLFAILPRAKEKQLRNCAIMIGGACVVYTALVIFETILYIFYL